MEPFLKQVCRHYFNKSDLSSLCFVLPNRRSMTFLGKYISDAVAQKGECPVLSPLMLTIDDFFGKIHGSSRMDKVSQLLVLYDCYRELNPKAEPLDEFLFWGDIILSDFNDVDKYNVNPVQLFRNVADFKNIDSGLGELSAVQEKALRSFLGHFSPDRVKLTSQINGKRNVKESFLTIWNLLLPLYQSFNKRLESLSSSYPGMVCREVSARCTKSEVSAILNGLFPRTEKYVFVGLNALNSCEKKMLSNMREAGLAEFCWDYSGAFIRDRLNKSSFFMSENVQLFPQAFELDPDGLEMPVFNVLSVPSATGQVKHLQQMLAGEDPKDCAIVLPDESLLMPLLNSIPPEIEDVNVTMGYPIGSSRLFPLVFEILALQAHVRMKQDGPAFYHKQVWNIFSNGIISRFASSGLDERMAAIISKVKSDARFYVPMSALAGSPILETIFTPAIKDLSASDSCQIHELEDYLSQVITALGSVMSKIPELALELDFARRFHVCLRILRSREIAVKMPAFTRLLAQLCQMESVPFHGEPLKGLQVMGPLETRALDFDKVIIFSANEGVFPRRNVSSSFIPPALRKGFDLPTYEYQDAVWAYYFYRLISRARTVWMVYDSRTEGTSSGEESRYVKQLQYHFGQEINYYVSRSDITLPDDPPLVLEKTQEDVKKIKSLTLSASSFNTYISCPAQFYYAKVLGLKPQEEVSESLDGAMTGNVFHDVMQTLYTNKTNFISEDYLVSLSKDEAKVRALVRSGIMKELKRDEISGRDLVSENVITRYVLRTIEQDLRYLQSSAHKSFHIICLEGDYELDLHGHTFKGRIDRLDSFDDGFVRVVDYKSGSDKSYILNVEAGKEEKAVTLIFNPEANEHSEVKAGLQFYIYDKMVQKAENLPADKIINTMYAATELFSGEIGNYPANPAFISLMDNAMAETLKDMTDTEVPFACNKSDKTCTYCDFKAICGKK